MLLRSSALFTQSAAATMAGRVTALALLLVLAAASGVQAGKTKAARFKLDLSLAAQPKRAPGMVFNDAWVAKIAGTPDGTAYRPDLVDWASVIQAIRVICTYEMRICNWCTRAAFHDGGANTLDEVGATVGTKKGQKVTAPAGGGGLDASLLLTDEQLRPENSYDSFSTFVAAVIRTLVGFYDISYADGLAVCGATAREMLTYGQTPVYSMMPAKDASYPVKKEQNQDFLVGRLDQNASNGAGILPGGDFTSQQFVDWFEKHFARGAYDGVALLGSHALLDNQGCVKSAEVAGPFMSKPRMFAWNAPNTYYRELSGGGLLGPSTDHDSIDLFRTDAPPKPISLLTNERCKFTATAFKDAAVQSIAAAMVAGVPSGPEPSFEWIDTDIHFAADPPGRAAIRQNGIPPVNPNTGIALLEIDPITNQPIVAPPGIAADALPHAPREAGYRTHRTCDFDGNCYDGWPYTQNDGFMGQSASNTSLKAPADVKVRTAVLAFQDRNTFDTAYGHAFVRLLNNGAKFAPAKQAGKGAGFKITGWECSAWLAGDGKTKAKNLICNVACRLPGGCPNMHMKMPPVASAMNCRCSTAPWGDVATQSLFPNSTQTAFGGIVATPSGLGRKLLAGPRQMYHHSADLAAGSGDGAKPKCPFARLRELGLMQGLF